MFNMFRTVIHPSSGACDFFDCITTLVAYSCFDVCWSFGVAGWGGIETRTRNHCGDTIKKSRRLLLMVVLMSETC